MSDLTDFTPVTIIPPRGHRARVLALVLLFLAPFAIGFLSLYLGQDANWDLRNYHWYNAYAFLNGRYGFDLLPSQTPYFYNPTLDVPFYLLATHLPAMLAGFILSVVQGLNFVLLFMLAYVSLIIPNPRHKVIVCGFLAALGILGGGSIAQIGTTFYDNITSLGMFLSALLICRYFDFLLKGTSRAVAWRIFLFGLPAGIMMGLKLPSFIFCVGLCFALLLIGGTLGRRLLLSFLFGLGILAGLAVSLGHWAWFLQTHFGNPLFPYFNQFFKAPLAPLTSARDLQYVTRSFHDFLFFPYIFADSPFRTGEIEFRDWRIPVLYALLPLSLVLHLIFGRSKAKADALSAPYPTRYLLWFIVLTYFAWVGMFCIYRYAVPIEMIAPLLIVFCVGMLPVKNQIRGLIAAVILIVIAATVHPGNWYRRATWDAQYVSVVRPQLGSVDDTMLLMAGFEPYAHLVTQFPPEMPVIRIQSNFASPDQDKTINNVVRERLAAHKGRFLMLIPPWQMGFAREAVGSFHLQLREPCQTVIDRLYDNKEMALCPVTRLP